MKKLTGKTWDRVFQDLRARLGWPAGDTRRGGLPSVSQVAADNPGDPFRILVSTMISLRTKDDVTLAASRRLFAKASTPAALAALTEKEIESLIYPAGFYKTKAVHIREAARRVEKDFHGRTPADRDVLMRLKGVGRKTANLVLNLGFGVEAICVDTHVHRISNRAGWVRTKTPEETEMALMEIMPRKYWIPLNELLVKYGQTVCTPASPHCGSCPLACARCERRGVTRTRE
ncbi:MAG: endonuclease III [Spirochaetales bacterium]|nr:endonuclease III [Spirochaetales bacterium]